ncbi:MAG: disulfide bond formation protein B [Candidatus Paceibacterota bacterium]
MTIENVHYVNLFLGTSIIIMFALALLALMFLMLKVRENAYLSFVKNNFLLIGFLVSLSAMLASLFYSEVVNFVPCFLCWVQRIFIYPQVILFGIAWYKKDRGVIKYSLPLLLVGILFSIYHVYIYYFGEGNAPCDPSGVSCVKRLVHEFGGLISIPSMAFMTFGILIIILLVAYFYHKDYQQNNP